MDDHEVCPNCEGTDLFWDWQMPQVETPGEPIVFRRCEDCGEWPEYMNLGTFIANVNDGAL